MYRYANLIMIGCVLACGDATAHAEEPGSAPSLDELLLEGLDDELDRLPPAKSEQQSSTSDDKPPQHGDPLLEGIEKQQEPTDPLIRIRGQMRRASELIAERTPLDEARSVQEQIVVELDALLEQARKQSQQQQQQNSNQRQQQASRRDQPSQGQQQSTQSSSDQDSQSPARDSQMRLQDRPSERPELVDTEQFMQELWGHLPERDRQQVINSTVETFIPKYELLIKEYFKRLAESSRQRSR